MDEKNLVEQVTREVISFLGQEGAVRAPGKSACAVLNGLPCNNCGLCVATRPEVVKSMMANGMSRISAPPGIGEVEAEIAAIIDHTLLKATATEEQIRQLCREAAAFHFASVCVNPGWVELCSRLLRRSGVKVCTVIGFPLGATTSRTKAYETRNAVENGAGEIDMVMNVGAMKSGLRDWVEKDIRSVVRSVRPNVLTKVIIETCYLTDEEKTAACELSKKAGADFVKTSTGFGTGGATVEDIALMRRVVGRDMGVKASGGVKDFEIAQKLVQAGASRLGASASLKIIHAKDVGGDY